MQSPKFKVLVVEDHDDTRDLYTLVLEQCNYEVVTADSVNDALHLLRTQKFDLFLLDSWLVDGSGLEICETVRRNDSATPIIFCSGVAFEKDKQEALTAGAQEYLVKPLNIQGLCETVTALIARSRVASASVHGRAPGRDSGDLPVSTVSV